MSRLEVAHLGQRLDGIPLAIELSGVRIRSRPLDRILQRFAIHHDVGTFGHELQRIREAHSDQNWGIETATGADCRGKKLWCDQKALCQDGTLKARREQVRLDQRRVCKHHVADFRVGGSDFCQVGVLQIGARTG
ncbi:hypothetical protein [Rhodococcus sp. WAY2]|uniref:hypothetical protein n=1 Tax=Rhodococcus sp. WAY2 TaxID=2663121 RepID=UPI00135AB98B|nr:hypothetical protein [Rhodococcus sp. WAY2]